MINSLLEVEMHNDTFLRRVLLADGLVSGASGLVTMLAAEPLAPILGLPQELLRYAGLSLLPFMALLVFIATRKNLAVSAVWEVIALNALWIAGGIFLLLSGWLAPTALGYGFMLIQILAPVMFTALEYLGVRKLTMAAV